VSIASPPTPPGPSRGELPAALVALARDPWMFTRWIARRYGDVARLPVPFAEVILLSHPDGIAHVNLKAPDRYERSAMVIESMRVEGSPHHATWFDYDDAEWARGRKLLQPHFTQKALAQLGGLFTEAITDEVDHWGRAADTGTPLVMAEPLKELALSVLYNVMFSRRIPTAEMPRLHAALEARMLSTTVRTAMFSMPDWVPRPFSARGARGDAWLDDHLAAIVADRRAAPSETTDLLNVLLGARYDDGSPIEDARIRTEMLFLVIGGHETTAAALLWTFAQLTAHPDVAARVYDEVDALGTRPVGPADMAELEYTRACFDETQRLQGGLVFNPKRAVAEDEIGGYLIRPGATVVHSNLTLQRDPRFWGADAERYRPERWVEGETPAGAFQNFGRGKRMCLGKRMAYIEAVLTIATAFQRYRFRLPAGSKLRRQYRMSMVVKGGLPLFIERRV
jgi:enediyne biosynthesis protein E7